MDNIIQHKKEVPSTNVLKAEENILKIIDTIKNKNIISDKDVEDFNNCFTFAVDTYTDVPQYRPLSTKLSAVVLNEKFPDNDAKFWQCKAEAEVHFNELSRNIFKYEKVLVDIDEINYKITSVEHKINEKDTRVEFDPVLLSFELKRLKITLQEYYFGKKQLEKEIKYRMKEISDWNKISSVVSKNCSFSKHNSEENLNARILKYLKGKISDIDYNQYSSMLRNN